MRLDSRTNSRAHLFCVRVRGAKELLEGCIWADDQTGEYAIYRTMDGRPVRDHFGNAVIDVKSAELELRFIHWGEWRA
jgi:hypothetical protein